MAPSTDRDDVMGPPHIPPPLSSGHPQTQAQQEIVEKYKNLKRRFFELEEESSSETQRSGERNVRMREERDYLLGEIQELEKKANLGSNGSPVLGSASSDVSMAQPGSSALPRSLQSPKARTSFVANLRQAIAEDDADADSSPILTSRHRGPQSRRHEEERKEREEGDVREARNRRDSISSSGSHAGNSPRVRAQTSADRETYNSRPAPDGDMDVDMENGCGPGYSYSRHSSNSSRRDQQTLEHRDAAQADGQHSPRRAIRQAIAAVAAAAAEAEAAATAAQSGERIPPSTTLASANNASTGPDAQILDRTNSNGRNGANQAHASSSTLAHALGHVSSTPTTSSPARSAISESNGEVSNAKESTSSTPSGSSHAHIIQHSPSMESILKVAEAAVAAQNAANQAKLAATSSSSQSNSNVNPNLDPSLFSHSGNSGPVPAASKNGNTVTTSSNKPPPVNTSTTGTNATASSSSATPTSAATPTSSLSNNPYLSLSTNLLTRASPGSTTPTGHPLLMHPYPLFYPPGTPVTPNSPNYTIPYNPYYYLAAPMPGPNGMYPPPANFPPPVQQRPPPPEQQRPAKPKRLKAHTVTTKSASIPMVPRDKKGKPMLPLNVGIMTVISLGEVCMREHFHTERYIFPVGYEVTRRYLSTVDPTIEVVYHCTILDGGDGPKFQIIPSDRPDKPIIAGTATGAWSNIVKQANAIRNRQHSNSVSGPDFFGLGQNTIKHLIQELPNADRLRDYVWQNFVEGGPLGGRHAAVIPALPEEYDASMPIGAYYPKRDVTTDPNVPRGMSHYPQHIIAQAEAQKAQKLAAQQQNQQQQAAAGPSGSGSGASSTTPQHANSSSQTAQHGPAQIMLSLGGTTEGLNIQEYQPPQNQGQPQSLSQGPEKRTTRSSGNTTVSAPPASTTARHTRAASKGNQQQQQAPAPVNGTGSTSLNADGTMPTTFAGIMNAYPAPGIAAPMPGQATTSTS